MSCCSCRNMMLKLYQSRCERDLQGLEIKTGAMWLPFSLQTKNYLDFLVLFALGVTSPGLNEASLFIRRLLRRAALFLWITPFSAALSMALIAFNTASFVSGSPASKAARAWLTAVRAAPRTLRLLRRRFSFCRFRLICDLILAKVFLRKNSCLTTRTGE